MLKKVVGQKKETTKFSKAIENLSIHDHLCLIYNNKDEQFAAAIPFMRIGIERGEKCIYIIDDNTAAEVLKAMSDGGINVGVSLKKGALTVISKKEGYLRNGYFDPAEMIQFLTESTTKAKKEGFSALRVTGEMTWMLGGEPGTDRLIEYEAKLNRFLPKNDCLALCQYNRNLFSPAILLDVIHTHPAVIVGNVVCKNFYYVPVNEFLKAGKGGTEEVDRLLKNLLEREQKEEEHQNDIRFMESMDKVNRAIQGTNNLEQMMSDVLDATLSIFDCDRAWLVYPSNPKTVSYGVPMERTKPEYPGALAQGIEIPVDPETIRVFRAAKLSDGPVTFNIESKPPIPDLVMKIFHVQSQLVMNIYPKVDKPYMFGLHQCSFQRVWTKGEKRLFQEIGRRLTDGLTSLLINRNLKKNETELVHLNRSLVMLSNVNQALIHATDEASLINEVCRIMIQDGGYLLAWVGYIEQGKTKKVRSFAQAGPCANYIKKINIVWTDEKYGRGLTDIAIRTGKTQILRDIEKDQSMLSWQQSALKCKFKSSIALPLSNEVGTFGCLTVYAPMTDAFGTKEIKILEELANDLAFGVLTLRLRLERTKVMFEREQFFKFFNLSTDIMVIADPNGAFQKVNPACLNILGYSEADLLSKPFIDFVHPDDKQSTLNEMVRQIKVGSSLDFENRYLCKDGKVLWISWCANYNKNDGITYATGRDITERKVAEEKLVKTVREREQALAEANKLAVVVENTFEAVSLVDICKPNFLLYVNSAWENLFGYKKSEVVNKLVSLVVETMKRDPKMEKIFWNTVSKGKMFSGQFEWQKKNGGLFWADVHTIPLRDENGKIYMLCNVIRDVTEVKIADRAKSEFVSLASHQLRTPLTGIKWLSELLLRDPEHTLTPDQVELLQGVILSNRRTITLVDDLLDVSHIDTGKNLKLTLGSVDIISLITFAIVEKKHLTSSKHITVVLDKTLPNQLVLTVDKEKMQQVFENLIDNAIKYSNLDTKIVIGAKFNSGDIVFFVQDHGVGIPEKNQKSIFNRFFRADNAAKIDNTGTGLGLYIAKGIVEYHHGKIWFESKEGKGSTFYFSLPLKFAKNKIVKSKIKH